MNSQTRRDEPNATRRDESIPTRRDESGVTRRDGDLETTPTLLSLPPALAARYRILEQLPTQGAEADLLLVEPQSGGEWVVIKLYRRGIQPKSEVLARVAASASSYVVRLLDHGQSAGIGFEILEYCKRGSLQDLLARGAVRETTIRALALELSTALRELHTQGILHRDLKPGNVLIRSETPLRLALTDFGVASMADSTLVFTSAHRTVRYAAPEAATGVISFACDYWSLGMILAEALMGRHPFAGLSETSTQYRINTQAVPLQDISEPWLTLCRGLLLRNPSRRWGDAEFGRWLADDKTLHVPVESTDSETDLYRASRPYLFQGVTCWTAQELAKQLAKTWDRGVKDLQRGLLLPWIREELRDQPLTHLLMDLLEDASLTPDERLLRLMIPMAPSLPSVWRGMSLSPDDLAALAERALQNDLDARREIQTLFDRGILTILAKLEPGYSAVDRAWQGAVTANDAAWQRAEQAGAPAALRPHRISLLPSLLLSGLSETFRERLVSWVQTLEPEIRSIAWFATLLEGETLPMAILPLILALAPSAAEESVWNKARQANTPEGYEGYLQYYPQGRFVEEARPLLAKCLEQPRWLQACQTNTLAGYDDYLQQYPQGHFAKAANQRLPELLRANLMEDIHNQRLRRRYLDMRTTEQAVRDENKSAVTRMMWFYAAFIALVSSAIMGLIMAFMMLTTQKVLARIEILLLSHVLVIGTLIAVNRLTHKLEKRSRLSAKYGPLPPEWDIFDEYLTRRMLLGEFWREGSWRE
ncbi:MAG: serine/threonine-protein kinase [Pseudomonadota bacterium]